MSGRKRANQFCEIGKKLTEVDYWT